MNREGDRQLSPSPFLSGTPVRWEKTAGPAGLRRRRRWTAAWAAVLLSIAGKAPAAPFTGHVKTAWDRTAVHGQKRDGKIYLDVEEVAKGLGARVRRVPGYLLLDFPSY